MILSFACLSLRSCHDRLHVVAVEVALEVEVRQLVAIRDGQELLERRIRLDVVLVLELVLLHVVVDTLRDLRAAHQSALGLHEEGTELIRDLNGALEDGGRARLGIRTLLGLNPATALASILNLAVDTLVQALHLTHQVRRRLTERREERHHALEVLIERGCGASGDSSDLLNRCGGHDHGCCDSGGLCGDCLLGSGLCGRNGCGGNGGSRNGGSRNGGGLLLSDLLSGRGGLGGGIHYTRGGGSLRGHFTHYAIFLAP